MSARRPRLCAALLTAALLAPATAPAAEVSGRARVIDGDSLRIGDEEIRLKGIDAPEFTQVCQVRGRDWRCGRAAAETLGFLLTNAALRCTFDERDVYGRALATCWRGEVNVNAMMVEVGMALAYRRYSSRYVEQEDIAREAKRGLWDSEFTPPWDVPRGHGRGAPASQDCPVKGNVNRKGEQIYHQPGDRDYARVRIRPDEGDRCFETAAAAEAAGFRAPRR
ncbi:MAG: thermonuclease family protein [Gammaproteobacteria bacterium]